MIKKMMLLLVGLLLSLNAKATIVAFDEAGIDDNGASLAATTILELPVSSTATAFNFAGTLDLVGNLNKGGGTGAEFGLYLNGIILKDINQFSENNTTNAYTFDFKNLVSGNYALRFNVDGGPIVRRYSLESSISPASFTTPVPEPESYALLMAGLGLMVAIAKRTAK